MKSSKKNYREFRKQAKQPGFSRIPMSRHVAREGHHAKPVNKQKRRSYLWEYIRWLKPFKWYIVAIIAMSLFTAGTAIVPLMATKIIIDGLLQSEGIELPTFFVNVLGPLEEYTKAHLIHIICGTILALIIVQEGLNLYRNWQVAKLNARVLYRLRQKLYDHMIRLPLHRLYDMKTGGITSRLSGDIDHITGLIQMGIVSPLTSTLQIAFMTALLVAVSWKLSIAATLILPPVVIINLLYIRRIRPIYRSMRHDRQDIDGRVVETFGGIRVVRSFGRERTESRTYAVEQNTVIRKQLLARFLEHMAMSGWGFLMPVSGLVIIWAGGYLVLQNELTIGGLTIFQAAIFRILMPVTHLIQSYGQTQQGFAALERVFDLLREPLDKPDKPKAIQATDNVATIAFEDVSFAYDGGEPVLKNIELDVQGGTTVALVGPSGSGKSTLTNLVARFYDPTVGALRLNGVDIRDIALKSYRDLIAIVQQDTFLFDGTISENIGYGRRSANQDEIVDAARRANAYDFIMAFASGFDTIVGERGVKLSGGQAQRISIARAILADPKILILDEATSSLDSESEQLIQASLEELLENRTTFVIAHRLSTIVHADMIVVLDQGQIVETGTHAELMAGDTLYRAMVSRQQKGFGLFDDDIEEDAVSDCVP